VKVLVFTPYKNLQTEVLTNVLGQEGVRSFDYLLANDNPHVRDVYKNVQMAYEKMREIVLSQYEKVWIVEADTIPPKDALRKLLEVDAPVVSGLYVLRHGSPVPNLLKPESSPNPGSTFKWRNLPWGETIEVSGGCMGCLLVDSEVLKGASFLMEGNGIPDMQFMRYCWENKIKQMARLDVICGHKRPDGKVLWPDKEQGWILQ